MCLWGNWWRCFYKAQWKSFLELHEHLSKSWKPLLWNAPRLSHCVVLPFIHYFLACLNSSSFGTLVGTMDCIRYVPHYIILIKLYPLTKVPYFRLTLLCLIFI
jgi:hypothetical protein